MYLLLDISQTFSRREYRDGCSKSQVLKNWGEVSVVAILWSCSFHKHPRSCLLPGASSMRFVSLVSLVSIVSLVSVVSLCKLVQQQERNSGIPLIP